MGLDASFVVPWLSSSQRNNLEQPEVCTELYLHLCSPEKQI